MCPLSSHLACLIYDGRPAVIVTLIITHIWGPQLLMSVLANCSILGVGMGMAFPSVSIQAMTNATDYMSLEEHEFSWFGKCTIHYSFKNRYNGTVCLSSGNRTAPVKHVCLSAASN